MNQPRIIVSLTSWLKRIDTVHMTIVNLKKQTVKPDKIVLYLAKSEFTKKKIPKKLVELCDDQFEIRWCENIGSYKKLIPALVDFPDDIIITVDDDIKYDERMVELLIRGYKKYPKSVQAHRVTVVEYLSDQNIKTTVEADNIFGEESILYKFTGVGGVLYPPHCLNGNVQNRKLFMALAPTGDDIWFWVHAIMNGRKIHLVEDHLKELNYIDGTQDVGLYKKNDVGGEKRPFIIQLKKVINNYPRVKLKLIITTFLFKIKKRLH
ncbi:hypothetical protein IJG89_00310 [Candidatus Saccharibacteria bacterium]|nr:hypothetical protein [Candidatus Saccharibacteria bacterium]